MSQPAVDLIDRIAFDAEDLVVRFPPRFSNARKRMLFSAISTPVQRRLEVSRWRGELPASIDIAGRLQFERQEDAFSYPGEDPGTVSWHLNFADAELFGFYGGPLLAQDEHQVLEHPVLGSVREALLQLQSTRPGLAPHTREGGPTPYLIKGAQRSISFDTISGPYGNAFATAPEDVIWASTRFVEPPTFSNILAMSAPAPAYGRYSTTQIEEVLTTATVGFGACRIESASLRCVIHTGNWGCGAFGGNPVLMAFLQLCAAQLAGIDQLVFHTFSPRFTHSYQEAMALLDKLFPGTLVPTADLIKAVHALGLEWGESDGN